MFKMTAVVICIHGIPDCQLFAPIPGGPYAAPYETAEACQGDAAAFMASYFIQVWGGFVPPHGYMIECDQIPADVPLG